MVINNRTEFSKSKILTKKRKLLVILTLIIILILFFFGTIFLFFLPYYKEIKGAYEISIYLLIGTIIIIIRIVVLIVLGYVLFKKWILHEESHYMDIPFLLGIFSYIFIWGKVLDIISDIIYVNIKYLGNFSELFLLNIVKLRVVIGTVNMFPIFLIGVYFYFFRRSLKKEVSQKEKNARKNTIIFLIFFFTSTSIIYFFLHNIQYISFLSGIVSLSGFSLLIWVFFTAYKGKILPEIRSLIVSIGFMLLLFFNVLYSILMGLFSDVQISSEIIAYLSTGSAAIIYYTTEGGNLVAIIIILIGFEKKATYYKNFLK
ncbi:MAG: hypothetical protein ACFFB0_08830 [Promethearchaeota archaeon]